MAIECRVRFSSGAYITSTVRGKRASCTHSDDEAVRRLGNRLLGQRLSHVERVGELAPGERGSRWLIVEVPDEGINHEQRGQ